MGLAVRSKMISLGFHYLIKVETPRHHCQGVSLWPVDRTSGGSVAATVWKSALGAPTPTSQTPGRFAPAMLAPGRARFAGSGGDSALVITERTRH